jgi:hypothetical protein
MGRIVVPGVTTAPAGAVRTGSGVIVAGVTSTPLPTPGTVIVVPRTDITVEGLAPAVATAPGTHAVPLATILIEAFAPDIVLGGAEPPPVIPTVTKWPMFEVEIKSETGTTRYLNGPRATGPYSYAWDFDCDSEMPGGFAPFRCIIPDAERLASNLYRYGAEVTVRMVGTQTVLWAGYLKTPIPKPDGTCELNGAPWKTILDEIDDPLLWQTNNTQDMVVTDSEPFQMEGAQRNADAIQAEINQDSATFRIPRGQDLHAQSENNKTNKSRVGWFHPPHKVRRIAFKVDKSQVAPGSSQPPAKYSLLMERWDDGGLYPTIIAEGTNGTVVVDANNVLENKPADYGPSHAGGNYEAIEGQATQGRGATGNPWSASSLITFGLFLNAQANGTDSDVAYRVSVSDVRINDLAMDNSDPAHGSYDKYTAKQIIKDLAKDDINADTKGAHLTVVSSLVPDDLPGHAALPNMLPLWWQSGTWAELLDYLATLHGYKWGVWEMGGNGPRIEFRSWDPEHTTAIWDIDAYADDSIGHYANAVVELEPSDDVYTHVDVTFTISGAARPSHARVKVPGVSFPSGRRRVFKITIEDPQRSDVLPKAVADLAAKDLSEEQWAGTCETSTVFGSSGEVTAAYVRAGDIMRIRDFPGGSKKLRIQSAHLPDSGPAQFTFGRVPRRFERLLAWQKRTLARRGLLSGSPT